MTEKELEHGHFCTNHGFTDDSLCKCGCPTCVEATMVHASNDWHMVAPDNYVKYNKKDNRLVFYIKGVVYVFSSDEPIRMVHKNMQEVEDAVKHTNDFKSMHWPD